MPQENVDAVQAAFDGWNHGAEDLCWADPNIELGGPDVPEVFRGHEGLRRFRDDQVATWEYFRIVPTEFIEQGDDVLVLARGQGRGRASGVEIDQCIAYVCTLREGQISRMWIYQNPDQALKALGLSE